jgi:hypothetical protein
MNPESCTFKYEMKYQEVYEAFNLLAFKWSKKTRIAAGAALVAITLLMLVLYYMDARKLHYFYVAIIAILLLFYMIYMPFFKAKKGAAKVMKTGGTYEVTLNKDGLISVPDSTEPLEMRGDKSARALETLHTFVLRTDNVHTFCLPKRVMSDEEVDWTRDVIKAHTDYRDVRE